MFCVDGRDMNDADEDGDEYFLSTDQLIHSYGYF